VKPAVESDRYIAKLLCLWKIWTIHTDDRLHGIFYSS
jgi:hypothetical protein